MDVVVALRVVRHPAQVAVRQAQAVLPVRVVVHRAAAFLQVVLQVVAVNAVIRVNANQNILGKQ